MENIIGRKEEINILAALKTSSKSEFVAVYGRRRVGKTYLIRTVFDDQFSFQLSGVANTPMNQQLINFHNALIRLMPPDEILLPPTNWFDAFHKLSMGAIAFCPPI